MTAFVFLAVAAPASGIPLWLSAPFALLLLLIAVAPLAPARLKHLWERFYPVVALGLGAMVAAYYLARVPGGGGLLAHTAAEYASFIILIGSLFTVAGGIAARRVARQFGCFSTVI